MGEEARSLIREIVAMILQEFREYPERVFESLRGDRVAAEILSFYNKLREGGLPENLVEKLTIMYAERLLDNLKPIIRVQAERERDTSLAPWLVIMSKLGREGYTRGQPRGAPSED